MIRSTFGGFMTARLGMSAAQAGLNLTGNNLTNSATTGYTRQRIDQVSLSTSGNYRYASAYGGNIGNGVLVTGTSQLRDSFLDLRYRNEVSNVGYEDVRNSVLNDLADILDEVKNASDDALSGGGIFNQLGDILEKLQQLSNQVGNKEFDSMVRTSCQQLVTLFNSYSARIQEVGENLLEDVTEVDIPRVNEILKNISELNQTIKSSEIHGESALELKDQRNLLIDELSEYMKINVKYTPVQVSDDITIEELKITMDNYDPDGTDYVLVDDQQYRQLEYSFATNGNMNITLSELKADTNPPQTTPVDPDIAAALSSAINGLNNVIAKNKPTTLVDNYKTAHEAFANAIDANKKAQAALTAAQTERNDAHTAWLTTRDEYYAARKKLNDMQKAGAEQVEIDAQQAKVTELQKATEEKQTDYQTKNSALKEATTAASKTQKAYDTAEKAYNTAYGNLPKDLTAAPNYYFNADGTLVKDTEALTTALTGYNKLPEGTTPITGGDGAMEEKLNAAVEKYETALKNYKASVEASKAPTDANGKALVVNDAFSNGRLRAELEMLNCEGEYDGSGVRGIGYYQNTLDTLANMFANQMNALNGDGKPLFTTDTGDIDGITADNIHIADGWLNNEYGLTASTQVDAMGNIVEGANDNILRFIMLFDTDHTFTTGLDGAQVGDIALDKTTNLPIFRDADGNVVEYYELTYYINGDGNEQTVSADGYAKDIDWENCTITRLVINQDTRDTIDDLTDYTTDKVQLVFNGTFEEMFTNIGTTLGLDIKGAAENLDNYELLATNLSSERDSVTGVSLDEEAMAIMQYTQSYNAAARLMTALDEMLDTLITGTGVVGR